MKILRPSSSHWFILWPTHIPCRLNSQEHDTPIVEKYGVRLFLHKIHSVRHTCSSDCEDKIVINAMVYIGFVNDDSIFASSITKSPVHLNMNIISCLEDDDGEQKNSTVYIEPIAVLESLSDNIPKTSTDINMILKKAKQPSYVILISS